MVAGAKVNSAPAGGAQAHPPGRHHPQHVGVGEGEDVAGRVPDPGDDPVGPGPTSWAVSPPGTPSRHNDQSGRSARMSSVVLPS